MTFINGSGLYFNTIHSTDVNFFKEINTRCARFFFASGAEGHYLDGGKTYRLHLAPNIPVINFWSLIPYDTQTRSVLQTDQRDTALTSESGTVRANADGSVDVYFGPEAPASKERTGYKPFPAKDHDAPSVRRARALVRQDVAAGGNHVSALRGS